MRDPLDLSVSAVKWFEGGRQERGRGQVIVSTGQKVGRRKLKIVVNASEDSRGMAHQNIGR